jgi:hypothetical protein
MIHGAGADVDEPRQSLWALTVAPAIWMAHLLVSYSTMAVWCGGARHAPLGMLAGGFALLTAVALAGVAVTAWGGWRRYQHGEVVPSHHRDTPEDRHRFLGLATLLLAVLSAVAIAYAALAVAMLGRCS